MVALYSKTRKNWISSVILIIYVMKFISLLFVRANRYNHSNIYKYWKNVSMLQLRKLFILLRVGAKHLANEFEQTVLVWARPSDNYGDDHYSTGFTSFFYNVFCYGFKCLSYEIKIKNTMDHILKHSIFFNNLVCLHLYPFLYIQFSYNRRTAFYPV